MCILLTFQANDHHIVHRVRPQRRLPLWIREHTQVALEILNYLSLSFWSLSLVGCLSSLQLTSHLLLVNHEYIAAVFLSHCHLGSVLHLALLFLLWLVLQLRCQSLFIRSQVSDIAVPLHHSHHWLVKVFILLPHFRPLLEKMELEILTLHAVETFYLNEAASWLVLSHVLELL